LTVRLVCLLAVSVLAAAPVTALAATAPSPETLRSALADPVDAAFVEAEVGTQGTLEGPFDANAYADYWRLSGTSETDIKRLLQYLERDGFVGGYARQWYRLRAADFLGELVMVFSNKSGAIASEQASKLRYQQDKGFQSSIESGLPKDSFAATLTSGGYEWTVIMFVKGNAMFAVSRGSDSDYMTDGALAQAQRAYAVAPSSIVVPGHQDLAAGVSQYGRLVLIVGLILLLAIATIAAVVRFALRAPDQRPAASLDIPSKP
jgi:hypothetical protein